MSMQTDIFRTVQLSKTLCGPVTKLLSITLALLISIPVSARPDVPLDFFTGNYLLVGKGLDSSETYTGKVELYRDGNGLKLKRTVNGRVVIGTAGLEPALGGDTTVLRFRYKKAGKNYEQTCLWQSDLDNYARISCYLYQPGVRTKNPGLEVLFHDRTVE